MCSSDLSTAQMLPLVVLGAAIAVGELLQLRPAGRGALPLSYAFFLVAVHVGSSGTVPGSGAKRPSSAWLSGGAMRAIARARSLFPAGTRGIVPTFRSPTSRG